MVRSNSGPPPVSSEEEGGGGVTRHHIHTHTHTVHTLAIAKQQQRPAITTSHPQVCLPLSFQRNGTQNKKKKKIAHVDALLLMWNGEENIRAILLLLQL
jgi:hypothetical protein